MMSAFIDDLINFTQGQLLIKYWWLWLGIIISALAIEIIKKD